MSLFVATSLSPCVSFLIRSLLSNPFLTKPLLSSHIRKFSLRLMASSSNCPFVLRAVITVILIFSVTCPLPRSVDSVPSSYSESLKRRKALLGSSPPLCVNKCLSCRPCMATLVIPPRQRVSSHEEETYYLLSWKCRCGDKLFQP